MNYPATTATAFTLPNDLVIILDPDSSAPVVSAQFWVETGSIHEDRLLGSGLSHFLEHMVFKQTRRFSGDSLASLVQSAGGHWNAYTTHDRTVYYIDGPSSGLPTFLDVLTDMVFFPVLPEAEFLLEKDVVRREIDMSLDNPDHAAHRLLFSTVFTHDARRHPVIGHRHLFDTISHADLAAYHRARYTPDRTFAVISGDFDPAAAISQLTNLTAGAPTSPGYEPPIPRDPSQVAPKHGRTKFAIEATRLILAWKIPPISHPDASALDLLASILGGGRSSRLYRALREDRPLALEIGSWSWNTSNGEGLFAISSLVKTDQRATLEAAIREELAAFPARATEAELARAKRQAAVSQFKPLASVSGRAHDLASNWNETRDLDFSKRYLQSLDRVTLEDIRRVSATRLIESKLSTVVIDPLDAPSANIISVSSRTKQEPITETLPNGLAVILLPDHKLPLVSIQAAIRAGLPSESPDSAGLNNLLAACFPAGTTRHNAAEMAEALEALGASARFSSGNNSFSASISGLSADLADLLDIFSENILHPAFPDDAIAREKATQLTAIRESLNEPLDSAFRLLRSHIFSQSGYGLPALGNETSLEHIDRAALASRHAAHFKSHNSAVAIAGDFNPAQALDLLCQSFSAMPDAPAWSPPASILNPGGIHESTIDKLQATLVIGFPGFHATHPARFAGLMLQEYCSDMSGPLFTRIREELGLAYQVGATQYQGYDTGLFSFYLSTAPEQLDLACEELLMQIDHIASSGIPDDRFESVRSTVLSGIALSRQSISAIASEAAINQIFGLPAFHASEIPSLIRKLTQRDVRAAAASMLATTPTIARIHP